MSGIVYHGARFLQGDGQIASAMAVQRGRIVAFGTLLELERAGWRTVDVGGGVAVAGFNDAHVHVYKVGQLLTSMLDLRGVCSMDALQAALRRGGHNGWVQGRGFNEADMREGRLPTRQDLDAVVPDRPVFLTRTCGHIAVANSLALERAGVTRESVAPDGGRIVLDEDGEPNGVLQETAMGMVSAAIPQPTARDYETMILAAAERHLAMGITSVTEAGVTPEILAVYRAMETRGALPYRVNVMALRRPLGSDETLPLPEKFESDFLRVDTIKLIADGGLSGATAAMRGGYLDGSHGLLRLSAEEIVALARPAVEQGLRVAVHAIGDAAIDATLDAFQSLQGPDDPVEHEGPTHRIEHFGLPDAAQLQRARKVRAVVVPQTIFLRALGRNFRAVLPPPMLERAYPVRAMLDAGLVVALSSDAPVVSDERPLLGIQTAVTRQDAEGQPIAPAEAITVREALTAYSVGGAQASGDAGNRGQLSIGMWADFTVLSDNPFEAPIEALHTIEVLSTHVARVDDSVP